MRKFLLATAALAFSAPAFAQPSPPPVPGAPDRGAPMTDRLACAVRDGKAAGFLARAHDRLAIASGQEAAWSAFAASLEAAVKPLGEDCGKAPGALKGAPLPQRLEAMEASSARRLAVLQKVSAAVAAFYPQLTPEQQLKADRLAHRHAGWDGHGHQHGDAPPAADK
jgi:hypothetical protein